MKHIFVLWWLQRTNYDFKKNSENCFAIIKNGINYGDFLLMHKLNLFCINL